MMVLGYLSAIRFGGADAGDFLHNQLSADVLALAPADSTFACYCEPRGRVLALLLVTRHGDDYYVIVASSLAESVVERLKIYVMRSKVDIEVLDDYAVAGLHAPQQPRLDDLPAPTARVVNVAVPDSGNKLVISNDGALPASSPALQNAWKLAELKRGIVWLCPATSGQFLPQMLGYDSLGAVNFRKGCYPGQEIVARTHYLGKVKRHPRLLCTSATICPDPLEKLQILGNDQSFEAVVTDCGHSEDGGSCIFVVTRMDPDLNAEQIEYQGQLAQACATI